MLHHKAFQKIIADFLLLHTAVQHTGAVKQELYNDVIGKRQIAFRANIEQYAVQGFIGLCYIDGREGCLKALKDIAALTLIFRGQTLIIQIFFFRFTTSLSRANRCMVFCETTSLVSYNSGRETGYREKEGMFNVEMMDLSNVVSGGLSPTISTPFPISIYLISLYILSVNS